MGKQEFWNGEAACWSRKISPTIGLATHLIGLVKAKSVVKKSITAIFWNFYSAQIQDVTETVFGKPSVTLFDWLAFSEFISRVTYRDPDHGRRWHKFVENTSMFGRAAGYRLSDCRPIARRANFRKWALETLYRRGRACLKKSSSINAVWLLLLSVGGSA